MGRERKREANMIDIKILAKTLGGKQFDITDIVSDPKWTTDMESQPGKFEFRINVDPNVFLKNGDVIELQMDSKLIFKGKVFVRKKSQGGMWRVVAYDNLRYLKNEDTIVFDASAIDKRFVTIMETLNLPYRVLDKSTYACAAQVADTKTYYTMLKEAWEETHLKTDEQFGVRDNNGVIELYNTKRFATNLIIGDNSLLSEYDYTNTIDEETYNSIKVVKEDKDNNTREIYVSKDSTSINKFGTLQIVEMVTDADANKAQMKEQGDKKLKQHNKEFKYLEMPKVIGHPDVSAGKSVYLDISDLYNDGLSKNTLSRVIRCTHHLESAHTMELEVEVL